MAQEQNYQVNYTINVEASQGTKQVIAFGEAVGKLVQAKASLTPAVTNIKNMMDEIDRVFRTKNGKKRSFDYRLTIDTKNSVAPVAFADSLGVAQGTSADIGALDGNMNTFSLYDTRETASPMAEAVFDLWRYGQSAYIPSVAQMRLLYAVRETVNPVIERCGGHPLPLDENDCWYWTSTEVSGQETAKAWLYSTGSGAMQETPKIQAHKVRPIITLNR